MKRILVSGLVLAFAVLLGAPSAEAKMREAKHTGFYFSFGFGPGSLGLDFEDTDFTFDREAGLSGDFRIGWALSQKLLLGLESNFWTKKVDDIGEDGKVTFTNAAASLTYYFTDNVFIKGGPAVGTVEVKAEDGDFTITGSKDGPGFTAGIGAEFRIANKFAIIPTAQWNWQKTDDLKSNFVSLTVGVGWLW